MSIELSDIYKAVCKAISKSTGIVILDSDINEPVIRPSFKIFMNTINSSHFSAALRELKVYFEIYFYAKDKGHSKSSIMDIEDKLAFLFLNPLKINENSSTYVNDLEFERVEDGILNCNFNLELATEYIDESEIEMMEILKIEMED